MEKESSQPPVSDDAYIHAPGTIPSLNKPPKIGGFLIFIAIGLVLSFLQNIAALLGSLGPFLHSEIWKRLTSPDSTAYHPFWKSVLFFELVANSAIVGLTAVTLVLFFRKHRVFPKVVVIGIPVIFILSLISYYLSGLIPAIAENPVYAKEQERFIIKFIALHVWIPYFLISKRVKETFVR